MVYNERQRLKSMGTFTYLTNFWSSVLHDKRMQEELKGLVNVEDPEEGAIKVIIHTLFVLIMDLKQERDDAINKLSEQIDKIPLHQESNGKTTDDNGTKTQQGKRNCMNHEQRYDCGIVHITDQKEVTGIMAMKKCHRINDYDSGQCNSSREAIKSQKMGSQRYRSLSRLSPKKSNNKKCTDKIENKMSFDAFAPETSSLDDINFHVDVEKRKTFSTETVSVPETLPIDANIAVDDYGNTDFFETALENEIIFKGDDAMFSAELRSPMKDQTCVLAIDPEIEQSPVLGKQHNVSPANSKKLKLGMPKILDFERTSKEPLQASNINASHPKILDIPMSSLNVDTNDLVVDNMLPQITSTPKYLPLAVTHSITTSGGDLNITSPSLLPSFSIANTRNKCNANSPVSSVSPFKEPDFLPNVETKCKLFKKSLSTFDAVSPKKKSHGLRRHQSDGRQHKEKLYEVHVEPPDPSKRKKYKQAKISEMPLTPKGSAANLTAEPPMTYNDEVTAALEASIKTKAMEDMLREKHEELLSERSSRTSSNNNKTLHDEDCSSESVSRSKKYIKMGTNQISLNRSSHNTSDVELFISDKEKGKANTKNLERKLLETPTKLRRSPRKKRSLDCDLKNPSKKRRQDNSDNIKENLMELDELLEQVNDSPIQKGPENEPSNTSPSQRHEHKVVFSESSTSKEARENTCKTVLDKVDCIQKDKSAKSALKQKTSTEFTNSFDIVPVKNDEPAYAHRGDVVRKKVARRQLEGWSCHECKNWYDGANLDPEEKKRLMNRCSRHRSKYNPITNTPKNFWNPEWINSEDSS